MKLKIFVIVLMVITVSCSSKINNEVYLETLEKGNKITNLAQVELLANVGKAIQKGGPEYAVEFCNLNAASIIDSLNEVNNCNITRVSEKNRNPAASLNSAQEKELWSTFEIGTKNDTVILANNKLVYYKRINIAMPACLNCHGNLDTDIKPATNQKLQELYPKDLATGYALNDFRGLWKIEFARK